MIINWLWYPFFGFSKHEKMQSFNKNMLGKFLGFDYMHENKKYIFFKREIDLKVFDIFFENVLNFFFEIFRRKSGILIPDLYFTV